jgi:ribosomal protein S18 acetylase RimI-like enzyme
MVVIREAGFNDLAQIVELALEMGYKISPQGIRPVLEHHIKNPDYYIFLAVENDQVIGMVGFNIKYYLHREKPVLYIGSIVVREKFRSLGIGKMLMAKVEEIAKQRGCNSIQLNSNKRRLRAHEFYKKLGFEEVSLKFEKKW